jgi:hypothetical protein
MNDSTLALAPTAALGTYPLTHSTVVFTALAVVATALAGFAAFAFLISLLSAMPRAGSVDTHAAALLARPVGAVAQADTSVPDTSVPDTSVPEASAAFARSAIAVDEAAPTF